MSQRVAVVVRLVMVFIPVGSVDLVHILVGRVVIRALMAIQVPVVPVVAHLLFLYQTILPWLPQVAAVVVALDKAVR
jgi:hypothetical protein